MQEGDDTGLVLQRARWYNSPCCLQIGVLQDYKLHHLRPHNGHSNLLQGKRGDRNLQIQRIRSQVRAVLEAKRKS